MDKMTRLDALTSLRFFAAFAVLMHHYIPDAPLAVYRGYSGVSFFFVLSGFVLAGAWRGQPWGAFMLARCRRIYPAYWFALTLALIASGWIGWRIMIANVALISLAWHLDAVNLPAWTLSCELFFYACFPLLIRLPARWLLGVGLTGWGILSIGAILTPESAKWGYWLFYICPATRIVEFMLGMAVARMDVPIRSSILWSFAALALTAGLLLPFPGWGRFVAPFTLPYAAIIVAAARPGALPWLSARWIVLLGESSYMGYLIQWPVREIVKHEGWAWHPWGGVGLVVVLAVIFYKIIEAPFLRRQTGIRTSAAPNPPLVSPLLPEIT